MSILEFFGGLYVGMAFAVPFVMVFSIFAFLVNKK